VFGLDLSHCVAYGDSQSDMPLVHRVPYSVGVSPDDQLRSLVTVRCYGDDLREPYRRMRGLLAQLVEP
jgi:phosphoserine phosphatase